MTAEPGCCNAIAWSRTARNAMRDDSGLPSLGLSVVDSKSWPTVATLDILWWVSLPGNPCFDLYRSAGWQICLAVMLDNGPRYGMRSAEECQFTQHRRHFSSSAMVAWSASGTGTVFPLKQRPCDAVVRPLRALDSLQTPVPGIGKQSLDQIVTESSYGNQGGHLVWPFAFATMFGDSLVGLAKSKDCVSVPQGKHGEATNTIRIFKMGSGWTVPKFAVTTLGKWTGNLQVTDLLKPAC